MGRTRQKLEARKLSLDWASPCVHCGHDYEEHDAISTRCAANDCDCQGFEPIDGQEPEKEKE